jgi:diguanylate cyclase (GGDEF)-like protein/PAS domain S-box-containing protein
MSAQPDVIAAEAMPPDSAPRRKFNPADYVSAIAILVAVIYELLYSFAPTALPSSIVWWIFGGFSIVAVCNAALDHRTWSRLGWLFIGMGTISLYVGDLYVNWMVSQSRKTTPGTAGWLAYDIAFILLAVGCLVFVRARHVREAQSWIDSAIVLAVGLLISLEYLLQPLWSHATTTPSQRLILSSYPLLLTVLLAAGVRLWLMSGREATVSARYLVLSIGALIAGQFGSVYYSINTAIDITPTIFNANKANNTFAAAAALVDQHATIPTPSPFVVLTLLFYGVVAGAAIDPSSRIPPPTGDAETVVSRGRIATLLILASLVPILLFIANPELAPKPVFKLAYAIGTAVIGGLVGLRVWGMLSGYRHSLHREKVLSSTAGNLASSKTVEEAITAATLTARDLTRDPEATVILDIEGHVTIEAKGETDALMESAVESLRTMTEQQVARLDLLAKVVAARTSEQLDKLLENASDVILLVEGNGTVIGATQSVERISGKPAQDLAGKKWVTLLDVDERHDANRTLDPDAPGTPHRRRFRVVPNSPEVEYIECLTKALPDSDNYIVTLRDVTAWERSERRLIFEVLHDSLTKLYNRAGFRQKLESALVKSHENGTNFAVLLLDLDDFKNVNDSLGHPAGDELLRVIAARIRSCLRTEDAAARLGGDEFGVVLDDVPTEQFGRAIAERILEALSEPVQLGGTAVVVSASIGVVAATPNTTTAEELERDADLALYEAKNAGKNQYAEYLPEMHDEAVRRLTVTGDLRTALDESQLEPFFQPIVALDGSGIAGVEALGRWRHPQLGLLSADDFIPIAEESGLIAQIDELMLEKAVRQLAVWQQSMPAHKDLTLCINISARRMLANDFVMHLRSVLGETGVAPESIILEITETVLMPGEGAPLQRLYSLANLGLRLYVDDFGTGWSSLTYLRNLPVHGIKLARDFVIELPDPQAMSLVRSIKDLVVTLGLGESVAEGIETDVQRQALLELGYHLGQGWYFARPGDSATITELLSKTRSAAWDAPTAMLRQESFDSVEFDDFDNFSGMSPM